MKRSEKEPEMMFFSKEQTADLSAQTFAYLQIKEDDHVLTITLNRPEKKNALNPVMLNELAFALSYAHHHAQIRAVVLRANGDVFCSGADLKAFSGQTEDHPSSIPPAAGDLFPGLLFRRVFKPCIAVVEGDVYAGGLLLLTGCTYVIASNDIHFSLPEVKRGLFPFQVMAGLLEIIPPRMAIDWCIRGYPLGMEQALEWGLITHVDIREDLNRVLDQLLSEICSNSPAAIRMGLEAFDHIRGAAITDQHSYLQAMLLKTLQTRDAREGLLAFREKRAPLWSGE